jgi:hypothetical protein
MVNSAACHHTGNEIEGAEVAGGKVQWDVVSGVHSTSEGADLEEFGHCAFSNDEVESPVTEKAYAGLALDRDMQCYIPKRYCCILKQRA